MKALDMMKPVKTRSLENVKITDKVDPNFRNYDEVRKALGVPLLDSWLAVNNPYMRIKFETNDKDVISFTVYNYIVGDVKNRKNMHSLWMEECFI